MHVCNIFISSPLVSRQRRFVICHQLTKNPVCTTWCIDDLIGTIELVRLGINAYSYWERVNLNKWLSTLYKSRRIINESDPVRVNIFLICSKYNQIIWFFRPCNVRMVLVFHKIWSNSYKYLIFYITLRKLTRQTELVKRI